MIKLFFDESGNTGVDLLSVAQPLFCLASNNLDSKTSLSLISPLLTQGQAEAKYSKLKRSKRGRKLLLELFSSKELSSDVAKFELVDKRMYLVCHLVDKLVEPTLHEAGIDLYAGDANVGLSNVLFHAGHLIFPNGNWNKLLNFFLQAIRRRSRKSFSEFDMVLTNCWTNADPEYREFATGLLMARGRLAEFIGILGNLEAFDPSVDVFVSLVNKWMKMDSGSFGITHDRSKPLRRNEQFLRTLMTPAAPRLVGYGNRQSELPLRVSEFAFADSSDHPQIQISDLIAGASVDCFLVRTGRRDGSTYHQAMEETCLPDLFTGGVLPSDDVGRKNEPQAGQKSIVDGTSDFLNEIGYFKKKGR